MSHEHARGHRRDLQDLRRLIEQAVRDEQLCHQLTGLPNARALEERTKQVIDSAKPFWLAFVEIDRFKTINDQFGYERANGLLLEVAMTLQEMAPRFFAEQAAAFHAHGDEFYVLGLAHPMRFAREEITRKLDAIREAIANIALTGTAAGLMKCTVSVGWKETSGGIARELMHDLEIAVNYAKRCGRNRVEMYDESMRKDPAVSFRSDCAGCQTSFSFEVPTSTLRDGDISCPNCGKQAPRPAHAARPPAPQDITDQPPPPSPV